MGNDEFITLVIAPEAAVLVSTIYQSRVSGKIEQA